ncbi:MAG: gliding motility-associated C-terminal domain-containing protein, partial [Bacteroidota bacterium]
RLSSLGATAGEYLLQYIPDDASATCLPDYQTSIVILAPPAAGAQQRIEERCVEAAEMVDLFAELVGSTPGGNWRVAPGTALSSGSFDPATGSFATAGQTPGDYRFIYQAPPAAGCLGATAEVTIRLVQIEVAAAVVPPACGASCSGAIMVEQPQDNWLYALGGASFTTTNQFASLCGGNYTLRAEDERGCQASTVLTVPELVVPEVQLMGDTTISLGEETTLRLVSNVPLDSARWSQPVDCLRPDCATVAVQPLATTNFTVDYQTTSGCTGQATLALRVDERLGVYVPSAFSPNGDGVNDVFTVYAGPGVQQIENFRLFDRWGGQLVDFPELPLGDPSFGWDGKARNGRALPPGVYVYQFTYTKINGDSLLLTGEVTLMR